MGKSKTIDTDAVGLEPTGEVVLADPGQPSPMPRITEEERAQLAEAWAEVRAAKNAQIALLTEAKRLDAERRVVEGQANLQGLQGQQLEQQVQQIIARLQAKYNIPEGWIIDAKTGLVTEPESKAENNPNKNKM